MRLNPIPEEIVSGLCHFNSLEDAVQSVKEIVQMGIEIARVELLNKEQMEISINFSNLENLEVSPTLFFEFHGTKNTNKESVDQVQEICKSNNGIKFDYSSDLKKEMNYGKQDTMSIGQLSH